jgi:hypothetical protein
MPREYERISDEELIKMVNKYMRDHPTVGRNHVIMHASGCQGRTRQLAKEGKIDLPAPQPKGSKSNWNKYFNFTANDKKYAR